MRSIPAASSALFVTYLFLTVLGLLPNTVHADQSEGKWTLEGQTQTTQPFIGVTHLQLIQKLPRPTVINVLKIDPKADGVRFLITPSNGDPNGDEPGDPNHDTVRQTVREYVQEHKLQGAINAAFFSFGTGKDNTIVIGLGVSNGDKYAPHERGWAAINITQNGDAGLVFPKTPKTTNFDTIPENVELYNAIGGSNVLLKDGVMPETPHNGFSDTTHPRTAAAVTAEGHVLLVTVDGRQPDYSEGASLFELADMLRKLGATQAINLDGGGSTTMVLADGFDDQGKPAKTGVVRVVNAPSDAKADGNPGRLRSNGASLGFYARPVTTGSYKPLAAATRPAPPKALPFPQKKIVLDDFETGNGRFDTHPAKSGSNRGIDKDKCEYKIVKTKTPNGMRAQALKIVRDKGGSRGLLVRHLSKFGRTDANEVLGRVGTLGYWLRTTSPNLKASIIVDDTVIPAKNKSRAHEKGIYRPINADGEWHFYAWDLQKVHHWSSFWNGNGAIEGPNTTLDAILIVSDKEHNKEGEVIELLVDAVTYDPAGDFE
ncbi:phosphodiester glycosidase family protein [Poriferisphaera sp. WC338]|uniref:phosphodiester glycosidase family protein n=1 Tax=Poriferisphaera sp. WC338 TaxID=3425129 RepID=UPI003D8126D8